MSNVIRWRPGLLVGILAAVGMLMAVACGAAEEATPTSRPPTATPTSPPPTATLRPGVTPVVATPTPTTAVPPTPTPTKGPQPKRGGIVKWPGESDPVSFDDHNATSQLHSVHNAKLYSNLLFNSDGKTIAPDVAESYEISADGKVWTFVLRDNVRFQTGYTPAGPRDGTLMTARDVEYSLEKIMGLVDEVVSARCGWMKEFIDIDRDDLGVVAVDDRTLKVHMKLPSAALASILILDHCALYPEATTREMLKQRPYGSGAYRLKEFQRGSLWRYERNPDYFKPGIPYLDEIHHVNIAGKVATQAAFLTGQLDIARGTPSFPTPDNWPTFNRLNAEGKIATHLTAGTCTVQGTYMNSQKPPFDNPQLRKAVHLSIDRKGYIEAVYDGYALPVTYLVPDAPWGHTVEEIWQMPGYRQPHDQDVAEARAIIQQEYPNRLKVEMQSRNTGNYPKMAEFIAGELRKIGVDATINLMDASQLFPLLSAWNYEIANYCMTVITITPEEQFGSYYVTGGSRNWLAYSNPVIDEMFPSMAATMDVARQREIILEMESIMWEYIPYAPTAASKDALSYWRYVQDFPVPNPKAGFSSYSQARLETIWRSDI